MKVQLGWTTFKDGTFELIVRDPEYRIGEVTLAGWITEKDAKIVSEFFPPCVMVTWSDDK